MAKVVHPILLATAHALLLLVFAGTAATSGAELTRDDPRKSWCTNLVLRNLARGSVTFQVGNRWAGVETGQRAEIEGVAVRSEGAVVPVAVIVKTNAMRRPVKKVLHIKFTRRFFGEGCRKALVLTAMESWRLKSGKYLVIRLGRRHVGLSFKL